MAINKKKNRKLKCKTVEEYEDKLERPPELFVSENSALIGPFYMLVSFLPHETQATC